MHEKQTEPDNNHADFENSPAPPPTAPAANSRAALSCGDPAQVELNQSNGSFVHNSRSGMTKSALAM